VEDSGWKLKVAAELKATGVDVDKNRICNGPIATGKSFRQEQPRNVVTMAS
jgi:hypothetical protein